MGVCGLTRPYESQQECVDAVLAAYAAERDAYCQSQCGNDQACYDQCVIDYGEYNGGREVPDDPTWDDRDCGPVYDPSASPITGWSAPYINGQPATPELLDELCPLGSPPPEPWPLAEGEVKYWKTSQYTGAGTPDIRKLVFKTGSSTGDPIADALFVRGTRNDLPALPWQEADDCGSCANPPAYEYDCDPSTDDKRFYTKTVEWEFPNGAQCYDEECVCSNYYGGGPDELGNCPPQRCKVVTITVTRTDKCDSEDVVTAWKAVVIICPCALLPIMGLDPDTGDLWEAAYGYESEDECVAELGSVECSGSGWQQVRHEIYGGVRDVMPQECCEVSGYELGIGDVC